MEMMGQKGHSFVSVMAMILTQMLSLTSARHIGVCYGLNGNNLPPPTEVVSLYKRCGIELLRLFEPRAEILEALIGSQLTVAVGPKNEDLPNLASSQEAANAWVKTNIAPYKNNVLFKLIILGNEVIPGSYANNVAPAMNHIYNALQSIGLSGLKVTTVLQGIALAASYPPSAGVFASDITAVMSDVESILANTGSPLMVNVYPYFAYSSDPAHISLDYALFNSGNPVLVDGEYKYYNLFDAMVDAYNAALEKINYGNVVLAVAESGWPTAGNEPYSSVANAKAHNGNLLNHVLQNGTPRKPGNLMETFFFAMFNENLKPNGVEQNFGFFYANMQPVYPFWWFD